jgi:hypothetical protein
MKHVRQEDFTFIAKVVTFDVLPQARECNVKMSFVKTFAYFAGTMTLCLPEAPAVKAATSFLVNFVSQSRELPQLLTVVQACGEQLVQRLLQCIGKLLQDSFMFTWIRVRVPLFRNSRLSVLLKT